MNKRLVTASALAALLACATAPSLAADNPLVVKLAGASTGSASLFEHDAVIDVNVQLDAGQASGNDVSIVNGTCEQPAKLAFSLSDTVSGQSQTQLKGTTVSALASAPHAIVVRKTGGANAPVIACGNIKG